MTCYGLMHLGRSLDSVDQCFPVGSSQSPSFCSWAIVYDIRFQNRNGPAMGRFYTSTHVGTKSVKGALLSNMILK